MSSNNNNKNYSVIATKAIENSVTFCIKLFVAVWLCCRGSCPSHSCYCGWCYFGNRCVPRLEFYCVYFFIYCFVLLCSDARRPPFFCLFCGLSFPKRRPTSLHVQSSSSYKFWSSGRAAKQRSGVENTEKRAGLNICLMIFFTWSNPAHPFSDFVVYV